MMNIRFFNNKSRKKKALFFGGAMSLVAVIAFGVFVFNSYADASYSIVKTSNSDFADSELNGTQITGSGNDASVKLFKNTSIGNSEYQSDVLGTSGLVSYWKMDGNYENSVTGAPSLTVPESFSGQPDFLSTTDLGLGGAVDFAGSESNFLKIPSGFSQHDLNTNVTMEGWVKLESYGPQASQTILSGGIQPSSVSFFLNNGYIYLNGQGGFAPGRLSLDEWTHIAVVRTPSTVTFYKNGVNVGVINAEIPVGFEDGLSIGNKYNPQYPLNGNIDELRIYDRELAPEEVASHYNGGAGQEGTPEPGLVAGWHFNELSGVNQDTYEDYSSNNHNIRLLPKITSEGKYGKSLMFDETNITSYAMENCISYGAIPLTRNETVEMWIKPTGETIIGAEGYTNVVDYGEVYGGWTVREEIDEIPEVSSYSFVGYSQWGGAYGSDLRTQIPNDEWHHLVVSHFVEDNKSTITHILDGVKVAEQAYNVPTYYDWFPGAGNFCLGKNAYNGFSGKFVGELDEVAIYDRVLNLDEVVEHIAKEYLPTGEWEQTFDLHWNGGWGDGVTDDSTAVSVLLSEASAEAKVEFQIRVASNPADFDENLAYHDIQVRKDSDPEIQLPAAISNERYSMTRKDLLDVLGPVVSGDHYVQIKAKFFADPTFLITPVIDEIDINYQGDGDVPEVNASEITIKKAINPDPNDPQNRLPITADDADVQRAPDGDLYITWTLNFEKGEHPYFAWKNAIDDKSGIKGYCLYVGADPNGDPEDVINDDGFSNMLRYNSPISLPDESGNPTKCQFIVPAMEGEKTLFDTSSGEYNGNSFWEGDLWNRNCGENGDERCEYYYLNIKAIDNENNVVNVPDFTGASSQLKFRYDDTEPIKNVDYLSLPSNYVSSKAVTMTWPVEGVGVALDDENFNTGIGGFQYKLGVDGEWRGDHVAGPEDYLGYDLIPGNVGSYTFSEIDFSDINNGVTMVYLRVFDRAGNFWPRDDDWANRGVMSAALKYDPEAAAPPTNLTVSPEASTDNSYAFSWDPPVALPVGVSTNDISYCYTVNTLPSEVTCTDTPSGVTEVPADAYATQPGENTFYVVSKSQAGVTRYEDYISVKFTYNGEAPAFGITNNIDISDISIKNTKNWKLAVSWDKPQFEGAGVSAYKILRSETEKNCQDFEEVGETSGTSYVDAGLQQKRYYYCVKACDNANNCGASSKVVSEFPTGKFTEPAKLTDGPSIDSITTSKASISWSTNRESDSKISFGENSDEYFKEEPSNSDQLTGHSIDLNNLSPGTTYYFKAKWTDEDGNTGISAEKSFKTEPAPTVKDVKVKNIGISSALVEFTTKGSSKVKMYYGESTSFGAVKEISTSSNEADYTLAIDDLNDNTKYYYKINTFDSDGREYDGTTLDFETLPRPKISNVRVQQVMDTAQPTVLVTWESNTEVSSVVTYYPEGNIEEEHHEIKPELISGEHKMVLRGLFANTPYKLVVSGIDKVGNEAVSEPLRFDTASDTRSPSITDLNIEGSNTNLVNNGTSEQNISQLVVSWNTDEPATSQVEFGEGAGTAYPQKTQEDSNLTYNHLVVISGLTPSKVYHLRAVTVDKAGNRSESVDSVSITPKESESALNLVITNLQQVFGFLNGN